MKLTILYINDVHGYLQPHAELFYQGSQEVLQPAGGYGRITGYMQRVRSQRENVLVFDGGDTFHGTLPVVQSKGEVLIPILNKMGIAAMVGHWDFAYGPAQLKHLASQLNYPILGINVYNKDGSLFLPPYILKEVGRYKIAVIGICSNIIDKTMPKHFSEGLQITDGTKELPIFIKEVKEIGANLIILLSHNGFPQDYDLLSKVSGVDICLSAHTHNRLYEAVMVNNTILIQSGCHGSFIGHLDVEFETNRITKHSYKLIAVEDNLPVDKDIDQMVHDALLPYARIFNEVVGHTPVTLHRFNTLNASMDNLLLAALLQATQCKLAFSNGWRYGAPIAKGPMTKNDLFNIIPHDPVISTVELNGDDVRHMLEENLERTFSIHPMQQMGGYVKRCMGMTAYVKLENPKGWRIQELYIGQERCEKEKHYSAAFVTAQGVPEKYGTNRRHTETKAVEAMVAFLKQQSLTEQIAKYNAFIPV